MATPKTNNLLKSLEKSSTVQQKETKSKSKNPTIEVDGEVAKLVEQIVDAKTQIKELEGIIEARKAPVMAAGMGEIIEQVLNKGSFENVKLITKDGKSCMIMMSDAYKKITNVEATSAALAKIVGAKNVEEYLGESVTYEISADALSNEKALEELVKFNEQFSQKFGISLISITKQDIIKKGSVDKLGKFVKKSEQVEALIEVLAPTKSLK